MPSLSRSRGSAPALTGLERAPWQHRTVTLVDRPARSRRPGRPERPRRRHDGVTPQSARRVDVRGVGIWAEQIGPADAVPVLLVQRMGALGFEWEPAIVEGLVAAGYRVITYDQRCFGWSDDGPTDRPLQFDDLVADAIGVLEDFDVTSGHLVGTSVGGVIVRCVAMRLPDLARSLTLIGSTRGDGDLPIWSDEFAAVATQPPGPSREERVDYLVRELRVMSDDRFDGAAARARAERVVARGWSVDAVRRSVRAAKSRSPGRA